MKNTYLKIVAVLVIVTAAAALTPMAIPQQAFAQAMLPGDGDPSSSTETDNGARNKCNNSGLGTSCSQGATTNLNVG